MSQGSTAFSLISLSQQRSPLAATLEQFDRLTDYLYLDAVLQAILSVLYPDRPGPRWALAWCRSGLR
jgi:hypothetical protein